MPSTSNPNESTPETQIAADKDLSQTRTDFATIQNTKPLSKNPQSFTLKGALLGLLAIALIEGLMLTVGVRAGTEVLARNCSSGFEGLGCVVLGRNIAYIISSIIAGGFGLFSF